MSRHPPAPWLILPLLLALPLVAGCPSPSPSPIILPPLTPAAAPASVPMPAPTTTLPPPLPYNGPLPPDCAEGPPVVRIWLANASAAPQIRIEGPCRVTVRGAASAPRSLPRLPNARAELGPTGIRLGNQTFPNCQAIELVADGDAPIRVDDHPYAGVIRICRAGDSIAIINILDMEQYLLGVLGGEMPDNWPSEALQAQAVAARAYALYFSLTRRDAPWDITSTVEDQVYIGARATRPIRDAVARTRGEILLHEGRLFPPFFHSTCGGETESPGLALNKPEFDFLEGVECGFCGASRYSTWEAVVSAADLRARLQGEGVPVPAHIIAVVTGVIPGAAGRAVIVRWRGGETPIPVVDFRRIVGRMLIKSDKFDCSPEADRFIFTGRGLGHGAGMCQYGAAGMAGQGRSHKDILAHYYRNTTLVKLY